MAQNNNSGNSHTHSVLISSGYSPNW